MKMAKSTTKNAPTEIDLEKIRRFTETELANLGNSELPICYQIGTDVLVGKLKVIKVNDKCWSVFDQEQQIFDFFTRKDAIFYCIAVHQKQYNLANEIKTADDLLNKLEFEATLFRHRYKTANAKRDDWSAEYYSTKYQETMHKLTKVKKELQKSLNLAKYIKV
jgi:hypothetical protein